MTDNLDKALQLEAEIRRLKQVVKELTAALKVVTESDERAKEFILRVEELLNEQ